MAGLIHQLEPIECLSEAGPRLYVNTEAFQSRPLSIRGIRYPWCGPRTDLPTVPGDDLMESFSLLVRGARGL